jgi:hypothetical protein
MARVELTLLGPPRLERDGVPLRFDTRKILALVAYVALAGWVADRAVSPIGLGRCPSRGCLLEMGRQAEIVPST